MYHFDLGSRLDALNDEYHDGPDTSKATGKVSGIIGWIEEKNADYFVINAVSRIAGYLTLMIAVAALAVSFSVIV